jgi:hypothetical protein
MNKRKQGKRNRAAGARFELKVRKVMEEAGYIIDKWTNNVDFDKDKVVPAKRKFNPFSKVMSIGTGLPDFIALSNIIDDKYDVIGIEVKRNGYLDPEERKKAKWYLEKKIFSKFLIARAKQNGRKIDVELVNFDKDGKKTVVKTLNPFVLMENINS